ncbi:MAG: hypothetical protein Q9160_001354 [Pyrenula sp. 1 TL-2023]
MNKTTNEMKFRCIEFDKKGNVTMVSVGFKKSEFITKYELLPRDLRKIDSSLLPSIFVRSSAILINLLHIRALIKHDRVLIFDAYGTTESHTQSLFVYDLEEKLRQKEVLQATIQAEPPYEFRALEAVLVSVTTSLESEFEAIKEPVIRVLLELEEDINREKLRHLLIHSKKLGTFEQRARLVRDAIDSIREDDGDLSAMYLSDAASGQNRIEDDNTAIEMLLDSYYRICDEIVQSSDDLINNIRNTEDIIKAILDANRNSLMLLDLKLTLGALGIGSGSFIVAFYGMNLKNLIEESDFGLWGISGLSTMTAVIVSAYGMWKLRKVQRVRIRGQ